jgi:hypothetical protein
MIHAYPLDKQGADKRLYNKTQMLCLGFAQISSLFGFSGESCGPSALSLLKGGRYPACSVFDSLTSQTLPIPEIGMLSPACIR